ncbi:MAG: hypothetical protein JRG91_11765 [Deltaproteobacteria bacterium]|nr:hypothetical protein [Deltaproteobacteria bacterium]
MSRILVIDDEGSRHGDLASWCDGLGHEAEVLARPPTEVADAAKLACIVIHAGYGKKREGFPRTRRSTEAVHWFLDDGSYLFHEDLEALRSLGRASGPSVPLVILTGGSHRDLPVDELIDLAAGRRVVLWNVFDLLTTRSLEEALAGPGRGHGAAVDPERLESEIRHDLLNRLWNLALAAGETSPDEAEIAAIMQGEDDQSPLTLLVSRTPALGEERRRELLEGLEKAAGGRTPDGLSRAARAAIEEIDAA